MTVDFFQNPLVQFAIGSFVSLISIVNPLMAAPLFVSLTAHDTAAHRNSLAKRSSINVMLILVAFFLAGTFILGFFGISIPALRIAGGLMILSSAFGMINKKDRLLPEEQKEAEEREDIAFSPLAMPLMSGPGAIAIIIGMTADAKSLAHYAVVIGCIVVVALLCYVTLRGSQFLQARVGTTMLKAFSRMMGFILLCVGVQFILSGTQGFVIELIHHH